MDKKQDSFFLHNKVAKVSDKKNENQRHNLNKKSENDSRKIPSVFKNKKEAVDKKPFDKKAYRVKKYSKKYKLEQWEEKRKKKLLYDYHKSIKNDKMLGTYKPKSFDEDTVDSNDGIGKYVRHPDVIEKERSNKEKEKGKRDPFQKAKEHYEKIKQEKLQKKQDLEKSRQERAEKIQEYKKKKQERFKKLSKKTKKGQPVMTGRLELLLEKIQGT